MATKEKVMGDLHIAVSNRLHREIADVESDPRYVGMAIKFLADNKVSMIKEVGNELDELDKQLQKRQQRFKQVGIADIAEQRAKAIGDE